MSAQQEAAIQTIKDNQYTIHHRDETIKQLHHTIDATVHTLGTLLLERLSQPLESMSDERAKEALRLIRDHSRPVDAFDSCSPPPPRYLRIPDKSYQTYLQRLRDTQEELTRYRELAAEQHDLVEAQSAALDHRVKEYEKCVKTIEEQGEEVWHLAEDNASYRKELEDYRSGARVAFEVRAEHEHLVKENDDLRWIIQSMKKGNAKQLGDREAEIENLRKKLQNAKEEVLARQKDVKNVILQTQALLTPPEQEDMSCGGLFVKARQSLLHQASPRGRFLPTSRSTLSLSLPESNPDLNTVVARAGNEPGDGADAITSETKPSQHMEPRSPGRTSGRLWTTGLKGKKNRVPKAPARKKSSKDSSTEVAPRTDSLSASVNGDVERPKMTVATYEKELPLPPDNESSFDSTGDDNSHVLGEPSTEPSGHDHTRSYHSGPPEGPPYGGNNTHTPISPHKRMLSNIPELPIENAEEEERSLSATSSDREAYRKSIDALTLIELMGENEMRKEKYHPLPPNSEVEQGDVRVEPTSENTADSGDETNETHAVETGVAQKIHVPAAGGHLAPMRRRRRRPLFLDESPPKTVSQMYHAE